MNGTVRRIWKEPQVVIGLCALAAIMAGTVISVVFPPDEPKPTPMQAEMADVHEELERLNAIEERLEYLEAKVIGEHEQ